MNNKITFPAILAKQSDRHTVFSFCARASEIHAIAMIDRIGRQSDGSLKGFQRPQVARHIAEIRKYLAQDTAILPNPIVLAFTSGVSISKKDENFAEVSIDVSSGPKGFVVDGQQRLTALSELPEKDFQVFVSGVICRNEDELRKQFILINNTRPLPKTLIYELLPTVSGLPDRLTERAKAARMVERLNFEEGSSLKGQIKQHTNPSGTLSDTAFQKLIMNSYMDGALRELMRESDGDKRSFELLSNFFEAVQNSFSKSWRDQKPRTSRLVHGAGIMSMGYVMEFLWSADRAYSTDAFCAGLTPLIDRCAWTTGNWEFGVGNIRPWNAIQNLPRDWVELSQFLIRTIKTTRNSAPGSNRTGEAAA
jgi:DGQHR domain-containing protein